MSPLHLSPNTHFIVMKIHFENADGSLGEMEIKFRPASVQAREAVRLASENGSKSVRILEKEVAAINAESIALNKRKEGGETGLDSETDEIQRKIHRVNSDVALAWDKWNWMQLRCAVTPNIAGRLTDEFLETCDQQEVAEAVSSFCKRVGV